MVKAYGKLGRFAEDTAAAFLGKRGYKVIARNYRGRFGEIDIVARQAATVCFIEVKARQSVAYGQPFEAVTAAKQSKIVKTAEQFLQERGWSDERVRFDVVSIVLADAEPRITLIQDAFGAQSEA